MGVLLLTGRLLTAFFSRNKFLHNCYVNIVLKRRISRFLCPVICFLIDNLSFQGYGSIYVLPYRAGEMDFKVEEEKFLNSRRFRMAKPVKPVIF